MGDVADILGLGGSRKADGLSVEASKILGIGEKKGILAPKSAKKPKGMSREVFGLLGQDGVSSSMQPQPVSQSTQMFKSKRTTSAHGKWIWSPVFTTSSTPTFVPNQPIKNHPRIFHWLKSDLAHSEYPYLKFNVQLDRISFTDEEYEQLLKSNAWTRSESEYLVDLCFTYELRWPVIADRYALLPARRTEELQDRFYFILAKLQAHRRGAAGDADQINGSHFNIEIERNRRIQQELMFHKTKQESAEEVMLKDELKLVDGAVKKSKKTSRPSERGQSSSSAGEAALDQQILSMVGKPALQSGRMLPPEQTTVVSKTLARKLAVLLKDLGLPDKMLPTKTVCDLYDQVRRDGTALLSLQSTITRREREIAALKSGTPLEEYADIKLANSLLTTKFPVASSSKATAFAPAVPGAAVSTSSNQAAAAAAPGASSSNAANSTGSTAAPDGSLPAAPKKTQKRKKATDAEVQALAEDGQTGATVPRAESADAGNQTSTKKVKREK